MSLVMYTCPECNVRKMVAKPEHEVCYLCHPELEDRVEEEELDLGFQVPEQFQEETPFQVQSEDLAGTGLGEVVIEPQDPPQEPE